MAPAAACAPPVDDWAIDNNTALLFSEFAPIEGSKSPCKRDDKTVIWASVPDAFDYAKPEVLFYFHGNNHHVKVDRDHKDGAFPDWLARTDGVFRQASGPFYGLDKLPSKPHAPLVLLPEVGTNTAKDNKLFAIAETPGRLASDKDLIKKMIDDCCNRLRRLSKSVGTKTAYLDTAPARFVDSSKLKRLYLTAHSGGGKPLAKACEANLARLTGKDDMPTDLWVFDATYGWGFDEYPTFCRELKDKGKLGNGPTLSRFVGIVIKNTGTDIDTVDKEGNKHTDHMVGIVKKLKSMGFGPKDLAEIEFGGDADIAKVKNTVMCFPITIIRIEHIGPKGAKKSAVEHEDIPKKFIPILLETAGQQGPDCGGSATTGFLLKVIDTNDQPLAGAKVTVKQQGNPILASKLDNDGTVFVQGNDPGQPCHVEVEGFGGLGREGHIDPDEADDGTLPEYDAGVAPEGDGSCGGGYTPPGAQA